MEMRDPSQINYRELVSMANLKNLYEAIVDHALLKFLVAIILSMNDWFFHPHHDVITVVSVFILLDTTTGLLKAHRNHNISSSGFFRFALKFVVYFSLLATGSLLDKVLPGTDILSFLSIMGAFLSLTESLSVLENVAGLGYAVPTKILSTLRLARKQFEESKPPAKEVVNKSEPKEDV